MITREELREHIGRRPFQPFRLVLTDGEMLDVTRLNQTIALDTRLMYVTPEDRMRRVPFADIAELQIQPIAPPYADF